MLVKVLRRIKKIHDNYSWKFILDFEKKLGDFKSKPSNYRTDYFKEEISRKYILEKPFAGNFLDVGGGDGNLSYLLGVENNLKFNTVSLKKNTEDFKKKYNYFAVDLEPKGENVIYGDICNTGFLIDWGQYRNFFNVIYSNNVFEHLKKPWIAAENLYNLLKPDGICITVVPFAARYHEVPQDYFRYTHEGLKSLFESVGPIEILESGYDIIGRRNNWQGSGLANDIVPIDKFGAWRENWYTILIFKKIP